MSKPATLANCIARMYEGGKLDNGAAAPAVGAAKKTTPSGPSSTSTGLLATLGRMEIKLFQLEGKVEQMASGQAEVLRRLDAVCQGIASLQADGTHVRRERELPTRDEAPQTQEPPSWVSEVKAMCGETVALMRGLQQEGTRQREKLEGLEGSVSVLGNVLGYVGQVFRSSKVVEFILNGVGVSSAPQEQKRDPPEGPSVSSHVTLCQETQVEDQRSELVKDTQQTLQDEKPPDQETSPLPPHAAPIPPSPPTPAPQATSPPTSRPTSPPPPTSRPTSPPATSPPTAPAPPASAPTSLPTPPPPPSEPATSESLPSPAESSSMPPTVLPLTRDGSVKGSRKPKEVTLKSREPSKVQVFAPEPRPASDVQKGASQTTVPVLERKPEGKLMSKQPLRPARLRLFQKPDKNGKNSTSRTPEAAVVRRDDVAEEREAPEPDQLPAAAAVVTEEPTGTPETVSPPAQGEDAVFIAVEDISTQQTVPTETTKRDPDQNDSRPAGSEDPVTENKEGVLVEKQDVAPNAPVPEDSRQQPSLLGVKMKEPSKAVTPVLVSTERRQSVDPASEALLPVVDDCRASPAPFEHRIVSAKQVPMGSYYSVKPNEVLGGGRFGQVHKCAELSSGLILAAKIIKVKGMKEREEVKNEIGVMNQLNHVNLIQLYDAFECRSNLTLIMEFVEGGELFDRIVDETYQLTEMDAIVFMRQICEGVQYLHQQYILHLDLKPENILCVTSTGNQIKIIDFGLARKYRPREKLKVNFGTPEFLAPEVVNYDFVSFPTDMWSVGVITYMLLSGLSPFLGDNDAETMNNILHATWDFDSDAFESVSAEAKDFISRLLINTRSGRLSASGCMKHSWLNNLPEKAKLHHVKLKSQVKLQRYLAAAHQWKKHFNVVAAANRFQRFCSQSHSVNTE